MIVRSIVRMTDVLRTQLNFKILPFFSLRNKMKYLNISCTGRKNFNERALNTCKQCLYLSGVKFCLELNVLFCVFKYSHVNLSSAIYPTICLSNSRSILNLVSDWKWQQIRSEKSRIIKQLEFILIWGCLSLNYFWNARKGSLRCESAKVGRVRSVR